MTFFKILWGTDAIAAIVMLYFFVAGLADGSVSSRNMGLWLIILAVLTAILAGSLWLRSHGQPALAKAILLILAIPALLYFLFILLMVISRPKWN